MRINNKQELDNAFAKDMDLFVAVIEPHADSLSLKIARKVPPIRLIKESGLDYYTIAKKNPPSGYKRCLLEPLRISLVMFLQLKKKLMNTTMH